MSPRILARKLLEAERTYRLAQLRHDGSENARRRYAAALEQLQRVELWAEHRLARLRVEHAFSTTPP